MLSCDCLQKQSLFDDTAAYQEKRFIDAISKAGDGGVGWEGGRTLQNLTAQKCRQKYCLEKIKQ